MVGESSNLGWRLYSTNCCAPFVTVQHPFWIRIAARTMVELVERTLARQDLSDNITAAYTVAL